MGVIIRSTDTWYCWWFRNPAITTWDVKRNLGKYLDKVYHISTGNRQDFWTINSVSTTRSLSIVFFSPGDSGKFLNVTTCTMRPPSLHGIVPGSIPIDGVGEGCICGQNLEEKFESIFWKWLLNSWLKTLICPLIVVCCLLFVVCCCLLFVVCCLLFVVCCCLLLLLLLLSSQDVGPFLSVWS